MVQARTYSSYPHFESNLDTPNPLTGWCTVCHLNMHDGFRCCRRLDDVAHSLACVPTMFVRRSVRRDAISGDHFFERRLKVWCVHFSVPDFDHPLLLQKTAQDIVAETPFMYPEILKY